MALTDFTALKANNEAQSSGLKSSFTPLGMWAFSIGTSIGWGSFIVTCNTYLQKSGILGTVLGLIIGMAVILVVTWNLQYMIRKAPSAGGIYSFTRQVSGRDLGFLAFWFVLLTYMAILWANITSLPLFARFFLGDTFKFGFHYTIFGYEVWLGEALLSICAVVIIGFLCANSSRLPNIIMIIAALVFTLGFTVCAIVAVFKHGDTFSYKPNFTEDSGSFAQIIRIAAISPWAFIGFENISHFSEEYKFPVKRVKSILISSVIVTTLLYLFVSVLSISAYPEQYGSWLEYISDMGNLSGIEAVPAFYAANYYLGQSGVMLLMFALFGVIITSLIGNMLALSRLLFAAGREGDAPGVLSRLSKRGIPSRAIAFIAFVSALIPFLGRTAIGWIVDVTTLGGTIIYAMISFAVLRHARFANRKFEKITGAAGFAMMAIFILLLLIPGLLPFDAMETESYVLFIIWSVSGLVYFSFLYRKTQTTISRQRIFVWVLLLVMVLFASMMWVSRATEAAADKAVEQIFEYHQMHPDHDSSEKSIEEREEYLHNQADAISKTNTIYTIVSLGLFLLCIFIMLNIYSETQRLNKRLNEAKRDALTGVKNKHAYLDAEKQINTAIENKEQPEFSLAIFDVNDLKTVNDTRGHNAGDEYLKAACSIICEIFSHSPVYRVGGDEFVVISQGSDYANIDKLMEEVDRHNEYAAENDGVIIACGMAKFDNDNNVVEVFDRADTLMYKNKINLKSSQPNEEQQTDD